jgi:hypothetical protein
MRDMVGDTRQPRVENIKQSTDTRQQKYRRECHLDNVSDAIQRHGVNGTRHSNTPISWPRGSRLRQQLCTGALPSFEAGIPFLAAEAHARPAALWILGRCATRGLYVGSAFPCGQGSMGLAEVGHRSSNRPTPLRRFLNGRHQYIAWQAWRCRSGAVLDLASDPEGWRSAAEAAPPAHQRPLGPTMFTLSASAGIASLPAPDWHCQPESPHSDKHWLPFRVRWPC